MVNHTVVDVDAHFMESITECIDYIEDDVWRKKFSHINENGTLLPNSPGDRFLMGRIERSGVPQHHEGDKMGPGDVKKIMGRVGLDKVLLFPNTLLSMENLGEDERMPILANAYCDYMLEEIVDPSQGIYSFIPAPYADPTEAADLIDRVGDEPGMCGVYMVAAGPEPPFGNRKFDPLYEAAQKKDLPIAFHGGGSAIEHFYISGYERYIETHTLAFLWCNEAQLTSIVVQGVPEKFPDLDFCFFESGIFWIATMMHRLDAEYLKRQSEAPLLTKRPSEYIEDFYFGTQPIEMPRNEKHLEYLFEIINGPETLMYASDYPHWDYDEPNTITDLSFLDEDEKEAILGGNAEEVFDI